MSGDMSCSSGHLRGKDLSERMSTVPVRAGSGPATRTRSSMKDPPPALSYTESHIRRESESSSDSPVAFMLKRTRSIESPASRAPAPDFHAAVKAARKLSGVQPQVIKRKMKEWGQDGVASVLCKDMGRSLKVEKH
ncbi:hypothetical protein T484DRAFT_1917805 [Baffinella frigidus]|nr:hypothetical protein T484DRAFT_1917805 [Cryptophyta sp. CCMP2293]